MINASPDEGISENEESRCAQYGRARFQLAIGEFLTLVVTLLLLTPTGFSRELLEWFNSLNAPRPATDFLFLVTIGLVTRGVVFPFQWLNQYLLDRRFGLSQETFLAWFWGWICRTTLYGLVTILCLAPFVETLRWWPWLFPLWAAAFLAVRPLFIDYVQQPLQNLFYPVTFLREETFSVPGIGDLTLPVYLVKVSHRTSRADASIRLKGKKSAIFVTDTLIDAFTDGEERIVIAHEFGHLYDHFHLESQTPSGVAQAQRKIVLGSAQIGAAAVALLTLQLFSTPLGLSGAHDLAGFPLAAGVAIALATALSPFVYREARRDEQDADRYALAATGDPANYVSVMQKLRRMNLEEALSTRWSRLFYDTHPTYAERIRMASEYRRRLKPRSRRASWRGWRHIQRHGRR